MKADNKFDDIMQEEAGYNTCWIVADGTMGMMMQSLAMAEALGLEAAMFRSISTPILRVMPQLARLPSWPLVVGKRPNFLKGPLPKLLITTGRRMAGFSIGLRRLSRGKTKTLHIQDPRVPAKYFDLLVVPAHDPLAHAPLAHDPLAHNALAPNISGNVITATGALNRLTKDKIAEAAAELPEEYHRLTGKKILVMLGGKNRRYNPNKEDFARLGAQLNALSDRQNASLILAASARTPKKHLAALTAELNPARMLLWQGGEPNPYPGLLGLADAIVITSDSVNMASEACITGKPVLIAELRSETGRIAEFHQRMASLGHTRPLRADDPLNAPIILDEMPEIARLAKAYLAGQF